MAPEKINLVYLMRRMVGGMQTHLIDLISGLDRRSYKIAVVSPKNPKLREKLSELAVPMIEVDIDDRLRPLKDWATIRELRQVLGDLKPDILHIHGNKSALVGRVAAKNLGIPVIIVTVHNFLIFQESNKIMRSIAAFMERRLALRTDKLITVSASLKKGLIDMEGIPVEKIVTIPNGIDISFWQGKSERGVFRREHGIGLNDFLVVNVGRLVPFKGHQVLLEAALKAIKENDSIKFYIAGDGPLKDRLSAERRRFGLENNLFFLGYLPNTRELFTDADLFVLPSINEPFGIVILEAMASGLPVIATGAGGVTDIVTGEEAVLVSPGDPDDLAEKIVELSRDKDLRDQLADRAKKRVREEFSREKMVSRTEQVYSECLREKSVA